MHVPASWHYIMYAYHSLISIEQVQLSLDKPRVKMFLIIPLNRRAPIHTAGYTTVYATNWQMLGKQQTCVTVGRVSNFLCERISIGGGDAALSRGTLLGRARMFDTCAPR